MFRLRLDSVAEAAGIPSERLAEIEAKGDATVFELERLATVYGIDSERLIEPIELARGDGIPLMAERGEFTQLGDGVRLAVMRAAAAAKDLVSLRGSNTLRDVKKQLPRLARPSSAVPFQQGKALAVALRKAWKLGSTPIDSVRDLIAEHVPALQVLHADLTGFGPAGLAFADELRGATLVLNTKGKNENPLVRRFSLLHELCHFLIDWDGHRPLVDLSVYLPEAALDREQRANAFAVRFLCPEIVLNRAATAATAVDPAELIRAVEPYGLHYAALRLYLRKAASVELPPQPPLDLASRSARWADAEEPAGLSPFPLDAVPSERRTLIAELAARAWSNGDVSRSRFAELLAVRPTAPVERVLDLLGLSRPDETSR